MKYLLLVGLLVLGTAHADDTLTDLDTNIVGVAKGGPCQEAFLDARLSRRDVQMYYTGCVKGSIFWLVAQMYHEHSAEFRRAKVQQLSDKAIKNFPSKGVQ